MRLNRIAFFTTLFSILCLGASFKAWADDEIETYGMPESHDFIQHRTYMGIFGTSADIDSNDDFNGYGGEEFQPVTTNTNGATQISNFDVNYLPAINRNFGFAGVVGHREGPWAIEASYWYSNHTATVYSSDAFGNPTTITNNAVYSTINVDLKRYFFTTLPIQPFIEAGVNFAYLYSQNTSDLYGINPSNGTSYFINAGNQTDSGYGLNLGLGAELYLGDGFSLVAGAIQRFTSFQQINGAGKLNETPTPLDDPNALIGGFEGNGINFYFGTTVGIE